MAAGNAENIATIADDDPQAALDHPQVIIKLAAEIGQSFVFQWFEGDLERGVGVQFSSLA